MIFMEGVIFITDEIITDILNIELKDLEDFSSYSKDGILYHDFTLKRRETSCPNCGSYSCNIKEYKVRKIKHSAYNHVIVCFSIMLEDLYVKTVEGLFMNQILLWLPNIQ